MKPGQTLGLYKGWWISLVAMVGVTLSYATLGVIAFSFMIGPWTAEFGWQRADISLALTLYTSAFVICAIPVGSLMDRFGVRSILLPSILLFGVCLGAVYFLTGSLVHLYGLYALMGVASVGTIPSSYTRVILNWFDRRRGLALAIALSGAGIGSIIMPIAIAWVQEHYGWRYVYLGMSAAVLGLCFPLVAVFLKERPSEGEAEIEMGAAARGPDVAPASATPQPPGSALRDHAFSRAFLLMFPAFLLLGLGTIGLAGHLIPLFGGKGISPAYAAMALSTVAAASVVARLCAGFLLDRFFAPYVAIVFLACPVIGLLLISSSAHYPVLLLALVLVGFGGGAEFDLMSYLSSRYFSLKAYARIYGAMFSAFYIGAGFGAWAMGYAFDRFGDYHIGLLCLAAAFLIALVLLSQLGPYPESSGEDATHDLPEEQLNTA